MFFLSFRAKIIFTIVLVVSVFSFISFTVYHVYLKDKLLNQTEDTFQHINLLRQQYYFTINPHDGRILKSFLADLEKNSKEVMHAGLADSSGKIHFPENHTWLGKDSLNVLNVFTRTQDAIAIKTFDDNPIPYNRVFIKMTNAPVCYGCHSAQNQNLGTIVLDLPNHGAKEIIRFSRHFSFYFTLLVLLTVFILVAYLHYKFIRKSLKQFKSTIYLINEGDLKVRLTIPESRELGELGKNFNNMLDNFEKTRNELEHYHQDELKNSQKLATIGEMSARLAHEIRNPITGIAQAIEVIVSDIKDPEHKPILEEIKRQANRVNNAISNLLRFSRTPELNPAQGNINDVIQSLVFFLQNQAHEKEITFHMRLQPNVPLVSFDTELIENVLLNISLNAIQAIDKKGDVTFITQMGTPPTHLIISIEDNGCGIKQDKSDEVFKPFFTTHTKGTGLGLSISKEIIAKHQGEIWFNNNPEKGCTFSISLPL